jgi:hypothetical protein
MNERGIPKPPEQQNWITGLSLTEEAWRWVSRVFSNYPKVQTFNVTINPTSVAANNTSEQTFTVTGLATTDRVVVNKPTHTAGLIIGGARCSAANTLAITFGNVTGSSIDPPSEDYRVMSIRL